MSSPHGDLEAFKSFETKPGEGFGILLGAMETHGLPVSLPPAPPYFRFADPGEAGRALVEAGFIQPQTRIVDQFWRHDILERAPGKKLDATSS